MRFYELDDDHVIWEDWGKFTEADVHHQYAIALKTPPYRKANIDDSVSQTDFIAGNRKLTLIFIQKVKVFIQLYRPGDDTTSEPVEFRYKPSYNINHNRKRPRVASFYDSEIPIFVNENANASNIPDYHVPQSDAMTDDSDIEQMFPDLFNNSQSELALNPEGLYDCSIRISSQSLLPCYISPIQQ